VPQGEVGEVVVRAPFVMRGNWQRADATAAAIDSEGWYRTGDASWVDADGDLSIHDRVKDMIVSAGENVYPAEVENAITGHPDVSEVAVIGVPDPRWGESVKTVIVPKLGASPSAESVIAWGRQRIGGYKVPKIRRLRGRSASQRDRQSVAPSAARTELAREEPSGELKGRE
jgi:acyl-CoA synthetase (AMP-forming)/AMP-acid ligase II